MDFSYALEKYPLCWSSFKYMEYLNYLLAPHLNQKTSEEIYFKKYDWVINNQLRKTIPNYVYIYKYNIGEIGDHALVEKIAKEDFYPYYEKSDMEEKLFLRLQFSLALYNNPLYQKNMNYSFVLRRIYRPTHIKYNFKGKYYYIPAKRIITFYPSHYSFCDYDLSRLDLLGNLEENIEHLLVSLKISDVAPNYYLPYISKHIRMDPFINLPEEIGMEILLMNYRDDVYVLNPKSNKSSLRFKNIMERREINYMKEISSPYFTDEIEDIIVNNFIEVFRKLADTGDSDLPHLVAHHANNPEFVRILVDRNYKEKYSSVITYLRINRNKKSLFKAFLEEKFLFEPDLEYRISNDSEMFDIFKNK